MIQQETFTRGGKSYTATFGIEAGKAPIYINYAQPDDFTGQPIKAVFRKLEIQADSEGNPVSILTTWELRQFTPKGVISQSFTREVSMLTNPTDMAGFIAGFAAQIQRFILNGKIRSLDGFNFQPLFDATGARIADTMYNTTAGPSNDYVCRNADGIAFGTETVMNADGTYTTLPAANKDITPWKAV